MILGSHNGQTISTGGGVRSGTAVSLPNLSQSDQFQRWALEQNRLGNISECIQVLLDCEQGDPLATFRAACLGQLFVKPNIHRKLMWQSFSASDSSISAQAQSFLVVLDFLQNRNNGSYCTTLLEELLSKLECLPLNVMVGEAKSTVLTNLGLIKSAMQLNADSKRLAAQALFLARHFDLPISEMRAKNLLIQASLLGGEVSDALGLIHDSLESGVDDQHAATYQYTSFAAGLMHLGCVQQAIEWLEREHLNAVMPQAIESVRQWYICLAGIDDFQNPIEDQYQPNANVRWLGRSLREVLQYRSLPRTQKHFEIRAGLLKGAIQTARQAEAFSSDWYMLLNRWVISLAQLSGQAVLSAHSLSGLPMPKKEWLDVRLLLAGLRLEHALNLHLPHLPIEGAEEELLAVFRDAEDIELASPEGLADLLTFWHPLAAAYLAVRFPNLPHLSSALEHILRLGTKNAALGQTVSPALAGELLLRSLGFDLLESKPLVQVKLGAGERGNFREEILRFQRGGNTYYQTPISGLQIAYGLKKHRDNPTLTGVAWAVLNHYGLTPKASGAEMGLRMNTLETLSHDLLNDTLSPQEFSRSVFQLV